MESDPTSVEPVFGTLGKSESEKLWRCTTGLLQAEPQNAGRQRSGKVAKDAVKVVLFAVQQSKKRAQRMTIFCG